MTIEESNLLTTSADLTRSVKTIADIGEIALIERLKPFCAEDIIGDDGALMNVAPGHRLVVTTDMLIENVHFSDRTTPPYSVGWRAAAANLSDIAAMGASLLGITVGLGLPGDTPLPWVEELYRGMQDCLSTYDSAIVGGDLCRATQRTLSITALGQVRPVQVISRSSAVPGMTVVVTGPHGASRAGLAVLLGEIGKIEPTVGDIALVGDSMSNNPVDAAQAWIKAHQFPVPRFDALACLRQLALVTDLYPAITGMDSSDGLANALLHISNRSQIGMNIVQAHIPLPMGLSAEVGARTALKWALQGGEDFELVLCLPSDLAEKFTQTPFATAIGTTTDTGIVKLVATADSTTGSHLTHKSFQHF